MKQKGSMLSMTAILVTTLILMFLLGLGDSELSWAGSPITPTPTDSPITPFSCGPILDDFDRHQVRIGSNWLGTTTVRHYRIADNQVSVLAGGPIYWKPQTFGSDQRACVTLSKIGRRGYHGLMLKVQDGKYGRPRRTEGFISVAYSRYDRAGSSVRIASYTPAQGWTMLATYDMQLQDGDVLAGRARADGTVEAFVNGVAVGTVDAGAAFVDKGGSIGLWFRGSGWPQARLDDFGGQ